MTTTTASWFNSQEDVITLARWLNEHDYFFGISRAVESVIDLFESPHKYSAEWKRMQDGGLEPDEDRCPACGRPGDAKFIAKYGACSRCDEGADVVDLNSQRRSA